MTDDIKARLRAEALYQRRVAEEIGPNKWGDSFGARGDLIDEAAAHIERLERDDVTWRAAQKACEDCDPALMLSAQAAPSMLAALRKAIVCLAAVCERHPETGAQDTYDAVSDAIQLATKGRP